MNPRYAWLVAERRGWQAGRYVRISRASAQPDGAQSICIDTPFRSVQVDVSPTGRAVHLSIDGAALVEVKP